MVNHFRTLLLNLSDLGDSSEHIARGFVARPLTPVLANVYSILFPSNKTRDQKILLGQVYTELLISAGLEEVFELVDSRITYDIDLDFNNFKTPGIDFKALYNKLSGSVSQVDKLLAQPRLVGTDKYDNLWNQHPNPVYKTAGLISAYSVRLS